MKSKGLVIVLLCTLVLVFSCQKREIIPGDNPQKTVEVTGISVSPTSHQLYVGESIQLTATVLPEKASDKSVGWESNSPEYASVSETGLVQALKEGSCIITVTSANGKFSATCKVTVLKAIDPTVHVESLTLDKNTHTLNVGETLELKATISPENASDKVIIWASDNPAVASVGDGVVTALAAGTVRITATPHDNVNPSAFDVCDITVQEPVVPPGPGERWADTGADVPAYPTYNTVSAKADFPIVEVTTDSGYPPASKDYYEGGTVRFRDPKGMYKDADDYVTDTKALKMQIRGRGNSTWEGQWGSKNPYRIKLTDHTKVFGMKGDKDWILLSDRLDPALIRTALALRISRLVSMPWTPKFRMARVTLNGEDKGLYYVVEQKEVDRENKIPITVQPGVVDSGYLLELDNKWDYDDYFVSQRFGKTVKFKDPDPNDDDASKRMTSDQKKYIEDYFNSVEEAMVAKNWEKVHSLIEMDTWIQYFIVNEVAMNKDGNMRLSTYFAKDSDTKLFMPMVWDFDRGFGQDDYQKREFDLPQWWPYGWFIRIRGGYPNGEESSWEWNSSYGKRPSYYQYLFEDPAFVSRLKELWTLYKPRLDMIPEFMDKLVEYNSVVYSSSRKSMISTLKGQYQERIQWLDTNIKSLEPQRYNSSKGLFEDL